ncbi:hypothetical protein ACHHYP_13183 [Achlya hypogyna]|uniref:Secreted protein n=1 Tax=Achlya hypogyna TaxID=1202772 RepID=A0A1V9YG04_ACHHY|nr:hypothetical protein ACHHYP_13183 [Achlya hypogyna]
MLQRTLVLFAVVVAAVAAAENATTAVPAPTTVAPVPTTLPPTPPPTTKAPEPTPSPTPPATTVTPTPTPLSTPATTSKTTEPTTTTAEPTKSTITTTVSPRETPAPVEVTDAPTRSGSSSNGHSPSRTPSPSKNGTSTAADNGDSSNLTIIVVGIIAGVVVLGGLVTFLVVRQKRYDGMDDDMMTARGYKSEYGRSTFAGEYAQKALPAPPVDVYKSSQATGPSQYDYPNDNNMFYTQRAPDMVPSHHYFVDAAGRPVAETNNNSMSMLEADAGASFFTWDSRGTDSHGQVPDLTSERGSYNSDITGGYRASSPQRQTWAFSVDSSAMQTDRTLNNNDSFLSARSSEERDSEISDRSSDDRAFTL